MTLRDIDMRPHPLGVVEHPEWPAVRNRHAERVCNSIAREAAQADQERRAAARHHIGDLTKGLILFAVIVGMWVMTIRFLEWVQF
ncbi:MAG: hypothetical protein ACRYFE_09135 [Janthinobacterium lividum]